MFGAKEGRIHVLCKEKRDRFVVGMSRKKEKGGKDIRKERRRDDLKKGRVGRGRNTKGMGKENRREGFEEGN